MKKIFLPLFTLLLTACGVTGHIPRNFSVATQELKGPVRYVVNVRYDPRPDPSTGDDWEEEVYRDTVFFGRDGLITEIRYGWKDPDVFSHGPRVSYLYDGEVVTTFRYKVRKDKRTVITLLPGFPASVKDEYFTNRRITTVEYDNSPTGNKIEIKYRYDGERVAEIFFASGDYFFRQEYEYTESDARGNWLRRISQHYDEDEQEAAGQYVMQREIRYY